MIIISPKECLSELERFCKKDPVISTLVIKQACPRILDASLHQSGTITISDREGLILIKTPLPVQVNTLQELSIFANFLYGLYLSNN